MKINVKISLTIFLILIANFILAYFHQYFLGTSVMALGFFGCIIALTKQNPYIKILGIPILVWTTVFFELLIIFLLLALGLFKVALFTAPVLIGITTIVPIILNNKKKS